MIIKTINLKQSLPLSLFWYTKGHYLVGFFKVVLQNALTTKGAKIPCQGELNIALGLG